jgi:hypothetical protein
MLTNNRITVHLNRNRTGRTLGALREYRLGMEKEDCDRMFKQLSSYWADGRGSALAYSMTCQPLA